MKFIHVNIEDYARLERVFTLPMQCEKPRNKVLSSVEYHSHLEKLRSDAAAGFAPSATEPLDRSRSIDGLTA